MDDRQIKMPAKKKTAVREEEDVEIVSQRQKPDVGRYLLQVNRQTKGSFHTSEDAQAAARQDAMVDRVSRRLRGTRLKPVDDAVQDSWLKGS